MRDMLLPEIDCYRVKSKFIMEQLGTWGDLDLETIGVIL